MKRTLVVAGALLVVVAAGVFVAVKRPRASAPPDLAPRPIVHEQPAVSAKVAEVTSAFARSATRRDAAALPRALRFSTHSHKRTQKTHSVRLICVLCVLLRPFLHPRARPVSLSPLILVDPWPLSTSST